MLKIFHSMVRMGPIGSILQIRSAMKLRGLLADVRTPASSPLTIVPLTGSQEVVVVNFQLLLPGD